MKTIDARGLACPTPVLQTKAMIDKEDPEMIQITVDNEAARQNVVRFLEFRKFQTTVTTEGNDIKIVGKRGPGTAGQQEADMAGTDRNSSQILVMISSDRMGHGDDDLGQKLMKSFISTLKEMGNELWRIVCVNSGVKLAIEGAESLPHLKELEEKGVSILVCGTCLTHFNLLEKKQVGETTNMLDIITSLQVADHVINL
ncbi:MAG: sulfurtransferase-like selenium metabolism protein YedF [Proteobacteria bacterium]|nr:sulfurtransferase-like selenium metabolism protein YedF [Pseudomonadota bacterium]